MRARKRKIHIAFILAVSLVGMPFSITATAATTLTITANNGSVKVTPEKAQYDVGEIVELIPKPDTGYYFTGWGGDAQGKRLVLNVTMDSDKAITANFGTWTPPIGIPAPEFGIFETYRMYDVPANRNPALTYQASAAGGYFTHYVDNADGAATDTDNPYGSIATPRITIPWSKDGTVLPAGSVVEIHHGANLNRVAECQISGLGTAEMPIFVRGVDTPRIEPYLQIGAYGNASYIIVEGISFYDGQIFGRTTADFDTTYISIRNCLFYGDGDTATGGFAVTNVRDVTVSNIVFYNNKVYDNGIWDIGTTLAIIDRMEYATNGAAQAEWSGTGVTVTHSTTAHNDSYALSCEVDGTGNRKVSKTGTWDTHYFLNYEVWVRCNTTSSAIQFYIRDSSGNESYWDKTTSGTANTWLQIKCTRLSPDSNSGTDADTSDVVEVGFLGLDASVTYIFDELLAWVDRDAGGVGVGGTNLAGEHPTHHVWIVDNEIYHNEYSGIQIEGGQYIYVGRNLSYENTQTGFSIKTSDDVIFSENTAYGHVGSPIHESGAGVGMMYDPKRVWFLFNHCYENIHGIRLAGELNGGRTEIHCIGNVVHDNTFSGVSMSEHLPPTPTLFVGNTIYNNPIGFYNANGVSSVSIIGNILANVTTHLIYFVPPTTADNSDVSYNLFYGPTFLMYWDNTTYNTLAAFQGATGEGTGCIEGDPLFVDADNDDFNLQSSSPAIDAGTSSGVVQQVFDRFEQLYGIDIRKDIEGNPRIGAWDIGAYEGFSSDPNNPTPVLQAIGDKSVDENSLLTFDVNATDPDGEPITYSAQSLPSGATFSGQTFSWTPSYSQAGSYQVRFIASDGNSQDSETITITVNNVNRAPVLGAIGDKSVNENSVLSFSVNATDLDGQIITYSVSGLPVGAVFASRTFTWTPSYDQAGTYSVTFTADDGEAQDSETITITVINVNRAPVLTAIGNKSVYTDDPLTFTIDATDPDGDAVTYSAGTLPTGATFTGQAFDWTPSQSQAGIYAINFIANDGQLQDSETVTITVAVDDLAPTVTNCSPSAGSIQVPLNNLITLNITDAGKGVDANSVTIKVNDNIVYSGNTDKCSTANGECHRIGTKADYRFIYQSKQNFGFDRPITVTVNATDLKSNVMDEYSYSFRTQMRSFGKNKKVNLGNLKKGRPATVSDSNGDIWAAWHAGPIGGSRDIYVGKLAAGADNFGSGVQLTNNADDQCNPVIAIGSDDKLYVAWQDNRQGDWDIYVSTSVDGISWSTNTRINDPNNGNQVNPAIVVDGQSPNQVYVVWQDDRAGNQDIYIAVSNNGFATPAVSQQITSNSSDQVEPAIAADSDNTIYVVWTDTRNNGKNDIYGAASNNGPWTNIAVVTEEDSQSSPAISTEAVGDILHLVWVDDRSGDDDIFYDKTIGGLSPLTGSSIIDSFEAGTDQISPVIITTGSTGNDLKVFACWRDERNADADLYFAEISSDSGTNVFVGDDGTNTDQSEPAIGIDGHGYPYLVWTNERTDILYAGSTFIEPDALASTNVSIFSTATVGTVCNAIKSIHDVSAEMPRGAYLCEVEITISRIMNPQKINLDLDRFSEPYEFSPSGMEFIEPVTITIPYEVTGSENVSYTAYWYNPLTDTLSQEGITDVETIVISSTLRALRFKTTHFSLFILGGVVGGLGLGGGGGGGCSVFAGGEGNIFEFVIPYIGLAVVMVILKCRDVRNRKARST